MSEDIILPEIVRDTYVYHLKDNIRYWRDRPLGELMVENSIDKIALLIYQSGYNAAKKERV